MTYTLLGVTLSFAALDWLSIPKRWPKLMYLAKPATVIALLAWFWGATGLAGQGGWFAAGLVFSLLGDIFLMLPGNLFLWGLISFLLAHAAYISAFNPVLPPVTLGLGAAAALVLAVDLIFFPRLLADVAHQPKGSKLRWGVLAYATALSLMLLSALSTFFRPGWPVAAAAFAALGGLLFFSSDTILAYDRFSTPIRNGQLLVHVTYHLGQVGIIVGAALAITAGL